jgi:hypothetical protein
LEFTPKFEDAKVVAEYTFTNSGKYTVTINATKASCGGCTVAELTKKTYQPGENGKLTVTFKLGSYQGDQHRQILLETDDKTEPKTVLGLTVHLPKVLSITPRYVFWAQGSAKTPKTIAIKIIQEAPLGISAVQSADPRFDVTLAQIAAGREYLITVTPNDTQVLTDMNYLKFQSNLPKERQELLRAGTRIIPVRSSAVRPTTRPGRQSVEK